jgi:DNA-binding transcriptional LysR family regulator
MELMQLEMFVAVVEERSFALAAQRVFRTPPAVSIALRKLEQQLGASLLDRSSRTAHRLTPAGEFVYESASRMVALKKEALCRLRGEKDSSPARLALGVTGHKVTNAVMQLGTKFCAANPDVRVTFLSGEPESCLRDIADRRLDAAFLPASSEQQATKRGFVVHPLPVSFPDGLCFGYRRRAARTRCGCLKKWCFRGWCVALGATVKLHAGIPDALRSAGAPGKRGVRRIG